MSLGLLATQAVDLQRGQNDQSSDRQQYKVGLRAPEQQIENQPHRHRHVVHHRESAGIDQGGALVPAELPECRRQHAHPHQYAPLRSGGRQLVRVAEQQPRRQHDDQRANEEVAEAAMEWDIGRITLRQMLCYLLLIVLAFSSSQILKIV